MQRGSGGGITEIFIWCSVVKRSLIGGEEFSEIYTWLVSISAIRRENSWHEHGFVCDG